jgi:hypothetical protein
MGSHGIHYTTASPEHPMLLVDEETAD